LFDRKVLEALVNSNSDYEGWWYHAFKYIIGQTGLERKVVRRACRSLARKGLAEYGKGLWNDDGEPAGAGYAATRAGRDYLLTQ
jgi:hypothetical protein